MSIFFTSARPTTDGKPTFSPCGAQSVSELPDFKCIKMEDLEVGASFGAKPSLKRTWIDPETYTFVHGDEGVIARVNYGRTKEG